MKIKSYILSLIAVLAMMVSCTEKYEATYLDGIKVSTSYVSLPVDGGSATMNLTCNGDWAITCCDTCETFNAAHVSWLNIEPAKGSAGTTEVKFSAEKATDGRNTIVMVKSNGEKQLINVIQGLSEVSEATCAEVIAGPDAKTYRTKGTVTTIANTTYGNFYINDGTGEIYVYGTLYDGKEKNDPIVKNGIEVGDEVTVEGPKTTYNGTIELVNVTVIKVNKSLIKVDSLANNNLPAEGGLTEVFLVNKGSDLYIDIPEDAQDWLSIKNVEGSKIVLKAASNSAGPRSTTVTFKTIVSGKEYTAKADINQEGLGGTLEVPFTVEEAIAYCQKLGGESPNDVYIKGVVSKIADKGEFGSYGNGTFYISSDGTYHEDNNIDFMAYSTLWLGNNSWAEGNGQIAVGQEVIICGKVTLYNGIAETASKKSYVYSINGVQSDANGLGTEANPFNALGAIEAANGGCTANVYVEGTVSKIVSQFSEQYGNGSFWISTDGQYNDDKSKDFEIYQAYWLDNQKWVEGNPTVEVGDKLTVYGVLTVYKGTAETSGKKAYVVKHTPAN